MDEHSSAPTSKPRPSSEPCPPPRARGSHTPRHESRKERSTKKSSKGTALKNWQRVMLAVLFLCGPIGTAVSFYLLPKESDSADTPGLIRGGATGATGAAGGTRVRMVHLSLAGTDRRARFVLDENTPWDAFVSGCRERLKVERILRVTDSSGEAILAVEDLVHEDHIVIHASRTAQARLPPAPEGGRPPAFCARHWSGPGRALLRPRTHTPDQALSSPQLDMEWVAAALVGASTAAPHPRGACGEAACRHQPTSVR